MSSRIVKGIISIILGIILIISLSVFFNNLSKNKSDKEIQNYSFSNIQQETVISYNSYGIPHIFANNEQDLFFAIGWAQAENRLWQMDFLRRSSYGKLSEIIGSDALPLDKFLRSFEIKKISDSTYKSIDMHTRNILKYYSDGVNAFIQSNKGNISIEFALLSYKPDLWKPQDCIAIGKLMALEMSISFISDITYGELAHQLGFEKAKDLIPSNNNYLLKTLDKNINPQFRKKNIVIDSLLYLFSNENIINNNRENDKYTNLQNKFFEEFQKLNFFFPQSGSNVWAVQSKSNNDTNLKNAILANDPHLPIVLPPIWFALQSTAPQFNVTGLTIPGIPLFLIGRNDYISWGITNMMMDCADFFVEKIDPTGNYYLSRDLTQKKIIYTLDTINIRNKPPYIYYQRKTEHSVIISDFHILKNAKFFDKSLQYSSDFIDSIALTYNWVGAFTTNDVSALYKINTAHNWQEFLQGRDEWGAPALNFAFASNNGDIGIAPAGIIPNRQKDCNPNFPNPGWQNTTQWNGVLPARVLPTIYNPEKGFVANANNPLTDSLPYFISNYWDKSSRIERITDYISNSQSFTIQDFKNLQMDVVSPHSKELMSIILPILSKYSNLMDKKEKDVLNIMKKWNFSHSANSIPASVFNTMHSFLLKYTFSDELGNSLYNQYLWVESLPTRKLQEIIPQENNPWFDNIKTFETENRDYIVFQSYRNAIKYLTIAFNSDNYKTWQWGKIHTLKLKHVFAENKLIRPFFTIDPLEMSGNGTTVNMEGWSQFSQFDITLGPSARFIANMSDSLVYLILPGGENGDPTSLHFLDQLTLWKNGGYLKILHSNSKVLTENLRIFNPKTK